ncbi:hypothetical protein QQW93_07775 [Pasteurella multocida]|uniref:hypothetical protein n=1 Tax=Pasteurella multocida TaxID=747 RepID=UPI00292D86D7|nr:hypothetical protein [Pasteurella multocida]MEB3501815.1 hypothetical protein [Pasteurella multocida]MEB4494246.1 hypothetical protein [Pasteurella multocida]MEB4502071.1 hypothetical protein [Pasteurella multocida]MEB4511676.1 hypothetical protein [Pasteurella multocida]MEB4532294.1 hypothetical protein [Pasteurella multocida]
MCEDVEIRINGHSKEFVIKDVYVFPNEINGNYQIYIPDSGSTLILDTVEEFINDLYRDEYEDGIVEQILIFEFSPSVILDNLIDFNCCGNQDDKILISSSSKNAFMRYRKSLEEQLKIIDNIEFVEEK